MNQKVRLGKHAEITTEHIMRHHLDLQFRGTLYVKQFQGYMQKSSCQHARCSSWV